MKVLHRYVCQFLSSEFRTDGYVYIKLVKLFDIKEKKPIGTIEWHNAGLIVDRNKYANGDDFLGYPYGGIILMETTDVLNSNGCYYRFIDFENYREDRDRSLAVNGWGRTVNRNFYNDYNICLYAYTSKDYVDTYQRNIIRRADSRKYANYGETCILEYHEYGPLPDCIMTTEIFKAALKELNGKECIEAISIAGVLIKLI